MDFIVFKGFIKCWTGTDNSISRGEGGYIDELQMLGWGSEELYR